ncbi:MAG: penicillin acylase family protein, partial [Myxococcales bacterium]|nr:penicillin acylase family protein [Myxococcales bacterium]
MWRPAPALAIAIGACAVVLAAAVLVARERGRARERLPQVTGAIAIDGLDEPVEVQRDAGRVAHVLARSRRDAWRALGFVHAQDRLGQMLWLRAVALGRTAEWIGEDGLPSDRFARTVGFA